MNLQEFFNVYFEKSLPVSFHCAGLPVENYFGCLERHEAMDGDGYQTYVRTMEHPGGNLTAKLYVRLYAAAVEWWLELSGTGSYDSPIIDELNYADLMSQESGYNADGWRYPILHWSHGSLAQENDFKPVAQNFQPEAHHVLSCNGGRASSDVMPYFNLQMNEHRGCIFAIGWNGQWRTLFDRLPGKERQIHFRAQMDDAHFRVRSKETLVLPKMLALPWEGELVDSFNSFRSFIRWNILPKYNGKPLEGYVTLRSWGGLTPDLHRAKFENVKKHQLGAELYQIDAGWNGDEETPKSDHYYFDLWATTVGTWKPLPALFPNGLGEMNRDCREADMGFCIWFEPERMPSWNKLAMERREYLVGAKLTESNAVNELWESQENMMVNVGDEAAREWIVQQLSDVITESQMEVFRIDFNYEPIHFWRYNDLPDRRGVSELKYVNGVYKMLDELLARHPGLKIDNCASGGRRLDYRMFRRSMPMICRSDYFCGKDNEPAPKQAHTYGLSMWIPAHGDSLGSCIGHTPESMDTYRFRSTLCSGIGLTAPWWDLTEEEAAWYRKMISDAKRVRPLTAEDFYPLTGYTLSELDWMAFQFHAPKEGKGMIMAFRREKSATSRNDYALNGLDPNAVYRVEDIDTGIVGEFEGSVLAEGLAVEIPQKRAARILFYEKI